MIAAIALALLAQGQANPPPVNVAVPDTRAVVGVDDDGDGDADGDPADPATAVPPLPSDDELRVLAQRDIGAVRSTLRRAARTASTGRTRSLAVALLGSTDASVATARICARALRLDVDSNVRRAGAECLGRVGPRLGASHTPALLAALKDPVVDVVTMAGWALANVGDAAAVAALNARVSHEDVRVGRLFYGYTDRLRERLGLRYSGANDGSVAPRASTDSPTAVPPGVVLTFGGDGVDAAAATGWLGIYGAMIGWIHGPLLLSAHGGRAGGDNGTLVGLGLGAVGAAAMSAYAFQRADSLPLAHTVVQLGSLGTIAGYGAGQLTAVGPSSGVASANLAVLGTVVGTGIGMAFVERAPPTVGALTAGMTAGLGGAVMGGSLAAAYGYPFDQTLGATLLLGGVAGGATTVLLAEQDIGLFPVAGAAAGMFVFGGVGGFVGASGTNKEAGGWLVVSGLVGGAALGGILGWMAPRDIDPLLDSTLKLDPPSLAILPGNGIRAEPVAIAMVGGSF